jgi:hypothetical protein
MGKFIFIDFRKREEAAALQKMVPELCLKMDKWIQNYTNEDGTPPNEDEAGMLEMEEICKILEEFDQGALKCKRVQDMWPERRSLLEKNLSRRKGKLFAKFSDQVEALQEQAATTMMYCMETFADFEQGLENLLPTRESDIDIVFGNMMDNCKGYIEASFPEGISGMDAYDDGFPDGTPSFAQFQEMVSTKQAEYKQKNKDAVGPAIKKVKEHSLASFKFKLNGAIEAAVKEIEEDLSDDSLPYLDEATMIILRKELVASAKEYAKSRLDD